MKKTRNIVATLLLAMVLVVGMMLPIGLADPAYAEVTYGDTHIHKQAEFDTISTFDQLNNLFTNGGSGYLTADIIVPGSTDLVTAAEKTVSLCLNGKTITLGGSSRFNVSGTFNLYGCEGGAITGGHCKKGGTVLVNNGGTFNMYGGTIQNSTAYGTSSGEALGGAVFIEKNCTFNMYDGNIKDCTANRFAGGVEAYGVFNMYGGTIDNCTATQDNGGGVEVESSGTMTMYGGTISNCHANNSGTNAKGGGISVAGTCIMNGGTITECTAYNGGGGVHVYKNYTFTMNGGKITNCSAIFGGGVNYAGTFTMNGGFIDTCVANGGGGVYGWDGGKFNLNGGTIQNCKTEVKNGHGGGVYATGSYIIMTGGTVKNNQAINQAHGGGFYVTGGGIEWNGKSVPTTAQFVMTGGEITGNTSKQWAGGGIFLGGQASFLMTGGLIENNKKGNESWTYGSGVAVYEGKGLNLGNKTSWIYIKGGTIRNNTVQKEGGNEARMMMWKETVTGSSSCDYNGLTLTNTNVSTWTGLKNAVSNAPTDGTPALITLTADINSTERLTIPYDKNIVLNMNGRNLTKTSSSDALVYPCRCPFTIVNLSATQSRITGGSYALYLYNGGDGYSGSNAWGYLKAHIIGNIYIDKVYCAGGTWLFRDTDNISIGSRADKSDSHRLYKVTLNANGGSGVPGKAPDTEQGAINSLYLHGLYKSSDGTLNLPTTAPNREDYTLKGWNTAANGSGTNYGFNYNNGNGVIQTLYAQWSQNQTLTFDANGHGTAPAPVTMYYDKEAKAADVINVTDHYQFTGWNTEKDGTGTDYVAEGVVKLANADPVATTLYAQWEGNKYKVTFNGNYDGSSYSKEITETYDAKYILPETAPTRTGYTFAGWFTDATGGTEVTASTDVKVIDAQTLYAHWTINKHTAALNNGEGSGDETVTATYDATLPEVKVPTWNKHVFKGYFSEADGKGEKYIDQDGKGVKAWDKDSDTTLYAYWLDSAKIEAMDLLLKEDIGMRFHTAVNDPNLKTGYMEMSIGSKNKRTEIVSFSKATDDANSKKLFKFDVNAIQLAELVTATYFDESGKDYDKVEQSVQEYYDTIPNTETYKKSKDMVKALLNYGHYAQLALSPIRGWEIGTDYAEITEWDDLKEKSEINDKYKEKYRPIATPGEDPTLSALNLSLLLDSKTTLCMYFTTTDGEKPTVTVVEKDNSNKAVSIEGPQKMSDGRWLVKIPNIAAQDLGKVYTVAAGGYTIELSALSYGATISGDANINAARALYEYYLAVQEFINPSQQKQ